MKKMLPIHKCYLGYYPKPSKSWLVVKAEKEEEARVREWKECYVGTRQGAEEYVKSLQKEWVAQLEELSKIGQSEPEAAYVHSRVHSRV